MMSVDRLASAEDTGPRDGMAASGRGSLADQAHYRLEEMIVTLEMEPGSRWSEGAICDRLGIGRTPVREALQRLAMEQLVKVVPRYGVIVTDILAPEQMMIVELRRVLEPLLASRASRRANMEERGCLLRFRDRLLKTAQADDIAAWLRLHLEMRRFIADCSRNKFLAASLPAVDALSRRFFHLHRGSSEGLIEPSTAYADILFAVATDNEPEAVAAAHRLVDQVEKFTRTAFHGEP